ncbi:MAG: tyrosine-type recombinase/integrase [Ruminiclostridium sp.]|nr:tyrosine-type recombinase/integrase [Ruminiclostridium sp.]
MANINKRGNSYTIRVSCGIDGNGKRISKSMTYKPPNNLPTREVERLVNKAALEFEERCLNGQVIDSGIRFRDFAEKWFKEYAEKQLRATSLSRYNDLMKRIMPVFGNMKLKAIRPYQLTEFYNSLAEEGVRCDDKYVGRDTVVKLIKDTGMTQPQFAKAAGVGHSVVESALHGRNIASKSAQKISDYLGKPIDKLFKCTTEGKRLASRTIQYYQVILSSMFSTAVEWEFLSENPCERAKPPRIIYKESRYLDEDGAAEVMDALGQEPYRYAIAIYIMLYTGLRRGEVCGLEWSDIDFGKRILSVNRNSLYIPEKGTFTDSLKTYSSSRVINLSDDLIDILNDYRTWQEEQAEMLGDKWKGGERIVTRLDGSPICPDTLSGWFYKFIRKNNLSRISLHSLRHTHATLLIACGIPLKTVSVRLGHASASTTSNIYVHAIQSANAAAAEAINVALSPHKAAKRAKKLPIKNDIA